MHFEEKLLLTTIDDLQIGAFFQKDQLIQLFLPSKYGFELSDIFVGKVKNVVPSIQAAFVEFKKDSIGFLPFDEFHTEAVLTPKHSRKLRPGDEVLVQVIKEPIKSKEAMLTTDITFSGEYFVIAPYSKGIHYSKKFSKDQRETMWNLISELVPLIFGDIQVFLEKYGLIVRTNATQVSKEILFKDLHDLFHRACEVLTICDKRTVFSKIYTECSFYEKTVKNIFKSDTLEIVTDDREVYYDLLEKGYDGIRLYEDSQLSLASLYGLKSKLKELLQKRVWLPCGGTIVIEPTEAMTVIDVNSTKASGGKFANKTAEEFTYLVNLEAAIEIARQMRLRNLSGMILIDFVNMNQENITKLTEELQRILKKDPIETVFIDVTALGLVEVTRKKVSIPLYQYFEEKQ